MKDHLVNVGPSGNIVFSPTSLSVNVGDNINFRFDSNGHNVRQTIGNSCTFNNTGFKSPNSPNTDPSGSTYTYNIPSSDAGITIFCACGPHWYPYYFYIKIFK